MKRWLISSRLARAGGKGEPGAGYTITEVMIVLAVSSAMFVAIALLFSGRQARIEFNQAVRAFEAELQNIMNDVSTGYYQSDFACTVGATGPPNISNSQPSVTGTNSGCIFLGKVITPNDPAISSTISTLVGRRAVNGRDVETIAEAQPVVIPGINETYNHSFQLEIRRIFNLDNSSRIYGVGFINPLSQSGLPSDSDGNGLIQLYGLSPAPLANASNIVDPASLPRMSDGVLFCLLGQNGQRAEVEIGAGGSQSTINSILDTQAGGRCAE